MVDCLFILLYHIMKTKRSITSDRKIETTGLRKRYYNVWKRKYNDTFSTYYKSVIPLYVNSSVSKEVLSYQKEKNQQNYSGNK